MKSHRKELWFHAEKRRELFNVTGPVQEAVAENGVREGLVSGGQRTPHGSSEGRHPSLREPLIKRLATP